MNWQHIIRETAVGPILGLACILSYIGLFVWWDIRRQRREREKKGQS